MNESQLKEVRRIRDRLRDMLRAWHQRGPHATHDGSSLDDAINSLGGLLESGRREHARESGLAAFEAILAGAPDDESLQARMTEQSLKARMIEQQRKAAESAPPIDPGRFFERPSVDRMVIMKELTAYIDRCIKDLRQDGGDLENRLDKIERAGLATAGTVGLLQGHVEGLLGRSATPAGYDYARRIGEVERRLDGGQETAGVMHADHRKRFAHIENELNVKGGDWGRRIGELEREQKTFLRNQQNILAKLNELCIRVETRATVDWAAARGNRQERAQAVTAAAERHVTEYPHPPPEARDLFSPPLVVTANGLEEMKPLTYTDDDIDATAYNGPRPCSLTFPRDPDTAEDPCPRCGMDERKHDHDSMPIPTPSGRTGE